MKQINLTIFSLLFAFAVFGQQDTIKKKVYSAKLMNVKVVLDIANYYDRTAWYDYDNFKWPYFGYVKNEKSVPTKAEDVMTDIDNFLSTTPTENNKKRGQIAEFGLIKKYRNSIDTTFQGLKLLGSDQPGKFFYFKGQTLPVYFGLLGDTALSFIVSGGFIDHVYDTRELTSRQRATKVVTAYILPSLKSFANSFSGKEIKYFGMTCVYGSNEGGFFEGRPKPEFVAFIAPAKLIKQYVAGKVTKANLINAAYVFVSDRDIAEIKKIKITLE